MTMTLKVLLCLGSCLVLMTSCGQKEEEASDSGNSNLFPKAEADCGSESCMN